jgi:hypothetical protein
MSDTALVISFSTATGRTYRLRERVSLDSGSWVDSPDQSPVIGDGTVRNFIVPHGELGRCFFQVVPMTQ